MDKSKITLSPQEAKDQSAAFGLLVHAILKEYENEEKPITKESAILFATLFFLSPEFDGETWQAAILSTMDVLSHRHVSLHSGDKLAFPEWDPEDTEHLDCYNICDAFMNVYAWNLAANDQYHAPEEYMGPVFSIAGHVLDGVDRGYHSKDDAIKAAEKDYLQRVYAKLRNPSEGKQTLRKQLDALQSMYEQFIASSIGDKTA